jgi:hypothetical protein
LGFIFPPLAPDLNPFLISFLFFSISTTSSSLSESRTYTMVYLEKKSVIAK